MDLVMIASIALALTTTPSSVPRGDELCLDVHRQVDIHGNNNNATYSACIHSSNLYSKFRFLTY